MIIINIEIDACIECPSFTDWTCSCTSMISVNKNLEYRKVCSAQRIPVWCPRR